MALPLLTLLDQVPDQAHEHVALANSSSDVLASTSPGDLSSAARQMPGSPAVVDCQRLGRGRCAEHRQSASLVDQVGGVARAPLDKNVPVIGARLAVGVPAVSDVPSAKGALLELVAAPGSRVRRPKARVNEQRVSV